MFTEFKNSMKMEIDMTDLGKMNYFLVLEVQKKVDGIFIGQRKCAQEMLQIDLSNSVQTPIVLVLKLSNNEGGTKVNNIQIKQILMPYVSEVFAGDN